MIPTYAQIRDAAYYRWQRRGHEHGHDHDDWLAAEQEVLFAINYEVAVFHTLDAEPGQSVGSPRRRVCRFCERSAPATTFAEARPALPAFVGNRSLRTYEECDECHALFAEGIDADLQAFLARARTAARTAGPGARPAVPPRISIAAVKGLARLALAVMPAGELESFEDTIEWVGNPDHDFDRRLFGALGCDLHLLPATLPHPWVALARRVDEEAPMPYMLFYLGSEDLVVEVPVPLCVRDEDLDGEAMVVPHSCAGLTAGPAPAWGGTVPLSANGHGAGRDTRTPV